MKRRSALQHLLIGATGVMLFPACDFENEIIYNNILIEKSQRNLLSDITSSILPKAEIEIINPEPTQHFILNNINQCFDKKDIEKFMSGLAKSQMYLKEKFNKRFSKLSAEENMAFLKSFQSEEISEEMKYFFNTTKSLAVQHFTGSEKYMTEQLDYEMVPSRYLGCVEI